MASRDQDRAKRMEDEAVQYMRKGVAHWDAGNKPEGDKHIRMANHLNDRADLLRGNAEKGC